MLLEQQASSREKQRWMGILSPLLTQGTRSGTGVLRVICWWDEARILGGGRVGQIPPPCGVGGETGHTVSLTVTTWRREGRWGSVFPFPHSKTLLGSVCSFVPASPHSSSSAPWCPAHVSLSAYFPSPALGDAVSKEKGEDHSGVVGLWAPSACSLPGCIYGGRWEPMERHGGLFQHCLGVGQKYSCQTITWRFAVF